MDPGGIFKPYEYIKYRPPRQTECGVFSLYSIALFATISQNLAVFFDTRLLPPHDWPTFRTSYAAIFGTENKWAKMFSMSGRDKQIYSQVRFSRSLRLQWLQLATLQKFVGFVGLYYFDDDVEWMIEKEYFFKRISLGT